MAQQAPSAVTGTEHFADALTSMACAAIPITAHRQWNAYWR
jgi:transcriptional regulator of acetoin/glycerol metabolism